MTKYRELLRKSRDQLKKELRSITTADKGTFLCVLFECYKTIMKMGNYHSDEISNATANCFPGIGMMSSCRFLGHNDAWRRIITDLLKSVGFRNHYFLIALSFLFNR